MPRAIQNSNNAAPSPGRPVMPKGYSIRKDKQGLLPWSSVAAKLVAAHNYWVASTRPDGRPHVMPVWGIWMDGAIFFGTDRGSRKGRNIAVNPSVTVHLESGDDVVIIEGNAREVRDAAKRAAIDVAFLKKYGMRLSDAPGDTFVVAIQPVTVFAWREKDFPESATRWLFKGNDGQGKD
jgi:nitroimidazol reductase NimA-like FMN-containing flavoprotein (pyridoxamine 5'-phosphate oxidase superfamily)